MFAIIKIKMFSVLSRTCIIHNSERTRGMATLKAISTRLKSVKNIQKITKSMKMVSAAKYSRAERELKAARPLGEGTKLFFTNLELDQTAEEVKTSDAQETSKIKPKTSETQDSSKNTLLIAVTSDRGLCGAVHSSVAKMIRNNIKTPSENIKIVCIGDKSRSLLYRLYGNNILFVCQEVGRVPPSFLDASRIANEILRSDFQYDTAKIVFNKFRSVVSYATVELNLYSADVVLKTEKIKLYEDDDEDDDEAILSFLEFSLATLIFYTMKEGACSEQSARMTAMDNASKNASEMISKLTLTFNRTRQAVITRELIEIISGASAL